MQCAEVRCVFVDVRMSDTAAEHKRRGAGCCDQNCAGQHCHPTSLLVEVERLKAGQMLRVPLASDNSNGRIHSKTFSNYRCTNDGGIRRKRARGGTRGSCYVDDVPAVPVVPPVETASSVHSPCGHSFRCGDCSAFSSAVRLSMGNTPRSAYKPMNR